VDKELQVHPLRIILTAGEAVVLRSAQLGRRSVSVSNFLFCHGVRRDSNTAAKTPCRGERSKRSNGLDGRRLARGGLLRYQFRYPPTGGILSIIEHAHGRKRTQQFAWLQQVFRISGSAAAVAPRSCISLVDEQAFWFERVNQSREELSLEVA